MKHVKSSSFDAAYPEPPIGVTRQPLGPDTETQSFASAINALAMARRYLIEGDERAAERKASAALEALRTLVMTAAPSRVAH
ncbi:hypothetical protein D8I35_18200 [Corticibacter populi]|uniref:DUF3077 domain-containing protein n=1 Tax=Corticibacter populi TaxID=1550736 RepID=A0A3M6QIN1_9BURK|nr:hypothetical protein [Corticibacter populi]RMX02581.1 hypothetical protein D8I35_18200 [Corticibacter populi]RZS33008.1 hypothetical protein EV687_1323 [Corticibacter populi]